MEKRNLHSIHIVHEGHEDSLRLTHGVSLLQGLINAKVGISHSCGGNATCGTCQVEVLESQQELPARNEIEQEMASDRGFRTQERLACQLEVGCDMKIRIPN